MKKLKRIFLLILSGTVLCLGIWIIIEEFHIYNLTSKIKDDPSLLIPICITLFSLFSFLFGFIKLFKIVEFKSKTYQALRVGDLLFSISFIIMLCAGIYTLIENPNIKTIDFYTIRFSVIFLLFAFCILLFFDNLKYHKKQKINSGKDTIDEIGS